LRGFQNFSFHFISGLRKLPSVQLDAGAKLYRGFGQRLAEMNDLYKVPGEVCWHQTSSTTSDQNIAYADFANKSGTVMELIGVVDAKDIRLFSMIRKEKEYIILHNSRFKVCVALTCDQGRLLDKEHKFLPDNVDLVILECSVVRPSMYVSPLAADFSQRNYAPVGIPPAGAIHNEGVRVDGASAFLHHTSASRQC
jgi:hypothetical protein